MAVKKKGLGKGLDSLIPDNRPAKAEPAKEPAKEEVKTGEQMMNINMVEPNREQPVRSSRRMPSWSFRILSSSLA